MQFETGDVVLLMFPYTAAAGAKQRPALVLLDAGDDDILVARVTTQPATSRFDATILGWSAAGLLAPSTVRLHKLASVEKGLGRRRLGRLRESDWNSARSVLRQILGE
jgi:mRNA interferase MazF